MVKYATKGLANIRGIRYHPAMSNHLTLSDWLTKQEISRAEFARRCEYDPSNLSKLLVGKVRPSLDVAVRIERITEGAVPVTGWAA